MVAFKTLIWIINIFSSLSIIVLVLMQQGKGADAGAGLSGTGSAQGGSINFVTVDGQYQFIAFTFDVGDFGVCAKRSSFRQFIAT